MLTFPARDVPILGQPFTVRAWFPVVLMNCGCPDKHALLIQAIGAPATCPSCQRSFVIQGLAQDPKTKQIGVAIAQVHLNDPATAVPVSSEN